LLSILGVPKLEISRILKYCFFVQTVNCCCCV